MNLVFDVLSQLRDTDYKKYLAILDDLESKFIGCGDADSLAFIQALKALEKLDKFVI